MISGAVGAEYRGDSTTSPGGTRSARLRLSQSSTKVIQEACSARNIDLIAAVHAAIAAINYTAAPADSQHKPYTSTIRTSLRPYLPAPYNTPGYACGLYTSGLMVQIPATHTWAQNAVTYHAHYTQHHPHRLTSARDENMLDRCSISSATLKTSQHQRPHRHHPTSTFRVSATRSCSSRLRMGQTRARRSKFAGLVLVWKP